MTALFRLGSFPMEQVTDLDSLERRLGDWFAGQHYPVRLLALSRRFDMRPAIQHVQHDQADLERLGRAVRPLLEAIDGLFGGSATSHPREVFEQLPLATHGVLLDLAGDDPLLRHAIDRAAQATGDEARALWGVIGDALDSILWRLPWAREMLRFYETLEHKHIRSATFLLIAWPPPEISAAAIAGTLRHAIGRPVQILETLPAPIDGPYREAATSLVPERPNAPHLAALLSYDARGAWDATTLHGLLDAKYDVAVAIDIHTLGRNQAMRSAEMAYNAARVVARDTQIVDMRSRRVIEASEHVMHELVHQSLHTVQIGVLVGGATAEELETNIAETSGRLGTQLRLLRPNGAHGEVIKLWGPTPRNQIDAPLKPRTMLSHGVGCCAGLLGYHRASNTRGLFWGLDAMRRAPLFFDLFQNNQAAHMVVLGKTGHGKTFYLNVLALRAAALEGYRVIGVDAFDNGGRIAAAARAGARCHYLGLETPINILDVVYTDADAEGNGLAKQVQHVIGQLALFLGTPTTSSEKKQFFAPRAFTIAERGVLDKVLVALYRSLDTDSPTVEVPLLGDLIEELETQRVPEAHQIARDLRMLLFGTDEPGATALTGIGQSFNAPTGLDWNFGHDINYYDFANVPEHWRPFYYVQAVSAILRFMRDPKRDRSRKTLLQIDEFGYLTQVEELAQLAATICKVARKYGIGLVAIDQNPITFLGNDNGRFIFENAVAKVLFHLDDLPARQIGDAISDLTPAHIEYLSHAGVGEALAVVGNDVYVLAVEANAKELRALRGS